MDEIVLHHDWSDLDPRDWDRCCGDEAESGAYYAATHARAEQGALALSVRRAGRVIAVAPLFTLSYRLDTSLQGSLRHLTNQIARLHDGLLRLDVIGFGSSLAERCHIGFDPSLSAQEKAVVFTAMVVHLRAYADDHKIGLVVVKDLAAPEHDLLAPVLTARGFAEVASLPVAVLDLPATEDAWLSQLSSATRKDIKRKLKGSAQVQVERVQTLTDELAQEIQALYEQTRAQSAFDYDDLETLPDDYFKAVSQALAGRAHFMLYRIDGELAAFNLLFAEPNRIIDKFLGMRYPLARQHDLYAVSWVHNMRFGWQQGARLLQTGQTAYAAKLRYGSRLVPSFIYFKHRFGVVTWVLRLLAPLLAFDRQDPDLQAYRKRQKKRETETAS